MYVYSLCKACKVVKTSRNFYAFYECTLHVSTCKMKILTRTTNIEVSILMACGEDGRKKTTENPRAVGSASHSL